MKEDEKVPRVTRDGVRLIKLPKLGKAAERRIKALRDWEKRSELSLMGFRARD